MEKSTRKYQPILMIEEYWRNCHFSVARFYGGLMIGNKDYKIVNEHGMVRKKWPLSRENLQI